jgi:protein-disulfide isomerase
MARTSLQPPVNGGDHAAGDLQAPLILVEYGDYQCPDCHRAFPVVEKVQKAFGDKLCFVFRHFPLANLHPLAKLAAAAAEAAGRQGKYWEMHRLLFKRQPEVKEGNLVRWADELGLRAAEFKTDLADPGIHQKIEQDFVSGARSGVNGTPTFFINGSRYDGNPDFFSLRRALETLLPGKTERAKPGKGNH